jgi:DNA polymerase-3 subunit delta
MKVYFDQLGPRLQKQIALIYWVSGDEPFQLNQARQQIRDAARQQGYGERQVLNVEGGFDWAVVYDCASALSLFADKQIIELNLSSLKIGDAGSKAMQNYVELKPEQNVLIISAPKLDANTKRSKWFKAIESVADVVEVWPLDRNRLHGWIKQRVRSEGMQIDDDAVALLAERVEGNMLACAQEIEKLKLLGETTIDLASVLNAVADSAQYDLFALSDSALLGDAKRYAHILEGLRATGTEPILVLWVLTREIRQLVGINAALQAGQPLAAALKSQGVWDKRQPPVKAALKRVSHAQWEQLLATAGEIDLILKGIKAGNVWNELLKLGLRMTRKPIVQEPVL